MKINPSQHTTIADRYSVTNAASETLSILQLPLKILAKITTYLSCTEQKQLLLTQRCLGAATPLHQMQKVKNIFLECLSGTVPSKAPLHRLEKAHYNQILRQVQAKHPQLCTISDLLLQLNHPNPHLKELITYLVASVEIPATQLPPSCHFPASVKERLQLLLALYPDTRPFALEQHLHLSFDQHLQSLQLTHQLQAHCPHSTLPNGVSLRTAALISLFILLPQLIAKTR